MVSGSYEGTRDTFVRVIERDGTIVHEWIVRWNDVWGSQGNFPKGQRPVEGMNLHGMDILPDGSLVANFEHLSTFRMNVCGDVVWKIDNWGHHSVFHSDQGYLWVTARAKNPSDYPNHDSASLRSWTLQKLTLDGELIHEIEIIDLLFKNDLLGLIYLTGRKGNPKVCLLYTSDAADD